MRKITLILLLVLASASHAQKIKLGVNAGATYSGYTGKSDYVDYKYGTGFLAGLSAEYRFNDRLALRANLSYERKTTKGESSENYSAAFPGNYVYSGVEYTGRYSYLTLPVLLRCDVWKSQRLFINGGPYAACLIKSEQEVENFGDATLKFTDDGTYDQTDFTRRFDYGFSFGIGKEFKLDDKNNLAIEIRDNLALASINDGGGTVKVNSISLIVGWSINL